MSVVRLAVGLEPAPGELPVHLAPLLRGRPLALRLADAGLLASLVVLLEPLGVTTEVSVRVEDWRPPEPGWVGAIGFVPGTAEQGVAIDGEVLQAQVRTSRRWPVAVLLGALLPLVRPQHPVPMSGSPVVVVSDPSLVGLRRIARTGLSGRHILDLGDVAVGAMAEATPPDQEIEVSVETDARVGIRVSDRLLPAVDITQVNPVGASLLRSGPPRLGRVTLRRSRLEVAGGGVELSRSLYEPWTQREVDALRRLDGVRVERSDVAGLQEARTILEVAALGVLVRAGRLAPATYDLLAPTVRTGMEDGDFPAAEVDDLEWMVAKTAQRRDVMWAHGADSALAAALSGTPAALDHPPSVSVILASRRPHRVEAALTRIARFDYPRLELVVGLHGTHRFAGADLAAIEERTRCLPFPVTVRSYGDDVRFGAVLAHLSALATGTLVTKVDDDDHYGPDHVTDLVLAHRYSGATIVGRMIEFVHLARDDLTRRRLWENEAYGEMVAGGTMMIARSDLERVGGWRPLARGVDRGLLERVRRAGGLVYATHGLGYLMERRGSDHTWRDDDSAFLRREGTVWPGLLQHPVFGTDRETVVAEEEGP